MWCGMWKSTTDDAKVNQHKKVSFIKILEMLGFSSFSFEIIFIKFSWRRVLSECELYDAYE